MDVAPRREERFPDIGFLPCIAKLVMDRNERYHFFQVAWGPMPGASRKAKNILSNFFKTVIVNPKGAKINRNRISPLLARGQWDSWAIGYI